MGWIIMKSNTLRSAISDNLENYKPQVKQGESHTLVEVKFPNVFYEQLRSEAKARGTSVSKLIEDYAVAGWVTTPSKGKNKNEDV